MTKHSTPQKNTKKRRTGIVKKLEFVDRDIDSAAKDVLPYVSFEAKRFRCFDDFKIDSFKRVNLITGLNNSGKTTLLEALFLHIGSRNPSLALVVNSWRGLDIISGSPKNQWASLFWQFEDSHSIELLGTSSEGSRRSLEISVGNSVSALRGEKTLSDQAESISSPQQNIVFKYVDEAGKQLRVTGIPTFVKKGNVMTYELRLEPSLPRAIMTGVFVGSHAGNNINEEIERFSDLRKKEKDGIVLDALKIIEPRLERLEILTYQGVSMIHGHLMGYHEPVPSPLLGDGVRRSLSVLLAVGVAEHGVVLVDEIENGIHHSAMKSLWAVIAKACMVFSCQIFATTHSDECIRAAHDAYKESGLYNLSLYRLDRKNHSIHAATYDEETLDAALSIPLEVRGWPDE
jgi:predicted ATPase